jgi:hypothetical protein
MDSKKKKDANESVEEDKTLFVLIPSTESINLYSTNDNKKLGLIAVILKGIAMIDAHRSQIL